MSFFRSRFLLLILAVFVAKSSANNETPVAICRAQHARCFAHASAENATAMRDSCQKCYHACNKLSGEEAKKNSRDCLNVCTAHDCIGTATENGVTVSQEYRCKVYGRWRYFNDKFKSDRHDLVKKNCGLCAEACNNSSIREDRGYCESRCAKRQFSCSVKPNKPRNSTDNPSANPTKPSTSSDSMGNSSENPTKPNTPINSTDSTLNGAIKVSKELSY